MRVEIFSLEDVAAVMVIPATVGPRGIARALDAFVGDADWDGVHRGALAAALADLTATGSRLGFAAELATARRIAAEAMLGVDVLP